jgi:anthranilate synthase/aminodeoxychorismate synthase-like glutamine amidotransferase
MLLVIDNYDSFTFNLVQYLGEMGVEMQVHRNDQIRLEEALALKPDRVLISPGPCSPREAGLSNDLIRAFAERRVPILGVCLGHQCICHTFGATVEVNYRMMHGKTSPVLHDGTGLFHGLPSPFTATERSVMKEFFAVQALLALTKRLPVYLPVRPRVTGP